MGLDASWLMHPQREDWQQHGVECPASVINQTAVRAAFMQEPVPAEEYSYS